MEAGKLKLNIEEGPEPNEVSGGEAEEKRYINVINESEDGRNGGKPGAVIIS